MDSLAKEDSVSEELGEVVLVLDLAEVLLGDGRQPVQSLLSSFQPELGLGLKENKELVKIKAG